MVSDSSWPKIACARLTSSQGFCSALSHSVSCTPGYGRRPWLIDNVTFSSRHCGPYHQRDSLEGKTLGYSVMGDHGHDGRFQDPGVKGILVK